MSKSIKIILVIAIAVVLCAVLLLCAIMLDDGSIQNGESNIGIEDMDVKDDAQDTEGEQSEDGIPDDVQDEPDDVLNEAPWPEEETEPEKEIIHRYEVIRDDITWLEAKEACEKMGGHLVTFQNEEEYEMVIDMVEKEGLKVFWAGARIYDIEENWENTKWITGEPFDFTRWYEPTNEPNKEESDELYLMIFSVDGVWGYNDAPSDSNQYYEGKIGYVCEFEEYAE